MPKKAAKKTAKSIKTTKATTGEIRVLPSKFVEVRDFEKVLPALQTLAEGLLALDNKLVQLTAEVRQSPKERPTYFERRQAERSASLPLPITTHTDERGQIFNITENSVESVALITSKVGTTRAKHYHKEDSHLCFVVSGRIDYYERPVGSSDPATCTTYFAGQAFFTGPMVEHEMFFPVDTVFITLGNRSRTKEDYEADLVRLEASIIPDFLKKTES